MNICFSLEDCSTLAIDSPLTNKALENLFVMSTPFAFRYTSVQPQNNEKFGENKVRNYIHWKNIQRLIKLGYLLIWVRIYNGNGVPRSERPAKFHQQL